MIYDVIPGFKETFEALAPELREQIIASRAEFSSLGELSQLVSQLTTQREAPPERTE